MKEIKSININNSNLPSEGDSRSISIYGDDDAVISMIVRNAAGKYYNWSSFVFETNQSSESRLTSQYLNNGSFSRDITFPVSVSADTYTIYVFAEPHYETELTKGVSKNPILYTIQINQVADTTLTFTPITTTSDKFATLPDSVTLIGSSTKTVSDTVNIDWDFETSTSGGGTFGLVEADQPEDEDWYVTTTDTVNGAISSATDVVIDDLTDIVTGMYITGVSGGSLSGTPIITEIDTTAKKLTLSSAQTFADGITLTFQAKGPVVIENSSDTNIEIQEMTASSTQLTTTVRGDIGSSTTVDVNGNYGISRGATITGVNWANTSSNPIVTVNASSTAGSLVMTVAQTVQSGTKLYIDGSSKKVNIKGTIIVTKFPTSDQIIYLNIDNIFTPGTGTA